MKSRRSINQDDLRSHNLSVIIDTMIRSDSYLGRADLAKRTGLTKATLSLLAGMLIDNHVVRELDRDQSTTSYGRPSTPLAIQHGAWAGIGMQVNTDGYGCLALDLDGTVIDSRWVACDMSEADPELIFGSLNAIGRNMEGQLKKNGYCLVGSGLALPGLIDGGMHLLSARNLGWDRLDLSRFEVIKHLHPMVGNEAKMAALAQIPGYATQRHTNQSKQEISPTDSFIYISTDIGIGGAVVQDGEVRYGDHGFAGELGHASVDINGPVCSCGRRGCLEVYAGRRALVQAAGIATGQEATSSAAADELYARWQNNDHRAVAAIDRALDAMSSVISSAINVLDIDTVVLGGFWTHFSDGLTQRLNASVSSSILAGDAVTVRVLNPQIGIYPALYGAAEMGLRQFVDDPLRFIAH